MAQYKVPQDVEAEDKLLGPFTFRQFIYLMITAGLIAIAVALFNVNPGLCVIPLPFIIFFAVLALPLKKDQPMETYFAAIVSFFLKPHQRVWTPGEPNSVIEITAPKIVEQPRYRDISGEEASHRLSFLADVVDTEGFAVSDDSNFHEDFVDENYDVDDMFERDSNSPINRIMNDSHITHRQTIYNNMQSNIAQANTSQQSPRAAEIERARANARTATPAERERLANLAQNKTATVADLATRANAVNAGGTN